MNSNFFKFEDFSLMPRYLKENKFLFIRNKEKI